MEHGEFVQKYRAGLLVVRVDREKAGFLHGKPGLMTGRLRRSQANLRAIAFGGVGLGIALFFFVKWWIAGLVLIVGLVMFPYCQRSGARGVLEASLSDPGVYQVASQTGVLQIDPPRPDASPGRR
jgi:hypothetical protein